MARYHVDTLAKLKLAQLAIDQSLGLRDAQGKATPREQMVHKPGRGLLPASEVLGQGHSCYDRPGTKARIVEGADGSAALEIDDDAPINAALGKKVGNVQLPTAASLIQVSRPREHERLPAGVRDKLDDSYCDALYALGKGVDDPDALATLTLELGTRAAVVHTRKKARARPP